MVRPVDERAIFITGPVVVFQWRNEAGWPVEYASANAAEVFGWSAEDFASGAVAYGALLAPEDAARVGEEVRVASESEVASFVHEPYRILHRDGSVRWLHDHTRILRDESGRATHFLGYVIDISDRVAAEGAKRELELRLLHRQKLESIGVLAGGIAHDFNNLLSGIVGQANLAQRALRRGCGEPVEHIDQIERLAMKAADLTRQLLAYSGEGRYVVAPLDIGEVVSEMVDMLDVIVSKKAHVELRLAQGLESVRADRAQLEQVAMNLITNASEALGDEDGHIVVETRLEHVGPRGVEDAVGAPLLAPGPHVVLSVSDDGCGMEAAVCERVFDPFFTTKQAGRGLGMSAVLGIVRGHEGAIRVRSAPGRGTTFELFLPATAEPAVRAPARGDRRGWHSEGTILVVDDEAHVRSTASELLASLGFSVLTAANGEEALAVFGDHRGAIRLVLLDLTMPVMDGAQTLSALRSLDPDLPVILSSGYDARDTMRRIEGARATFLQKPYRLSDLEDSVRSTLTARAHV